jgi:hypothetical protein
VHPRRAGECLRNTQVFDDPGLLLVGASAGHSRTAHAGVQHQPAASWQSRCPVVNIVNR